MDGVEGGAHGGDGSAGGAHGVEGCGVDGCSVARSAGGVHGVEGCGVAGSCGMEDLRVRCVKRARCRRTTAHAAIKAAGSVRGFGFAFRLRLGFEFGLGFGLGLGQG